MIQILKNAFILTFVIFLITGCTNQKSQSLKPPKGVISIEEAKILDKTYTVTRQIVLDSALGIEDSRSSWWSLEDLEAYIDYAKTQAKEKGMEVNGLRIYHGAYPKDYGTREEAGYSTLFIVPTGTHSTKEGSILVNFSSQQSESDLEIAPLNMGHSRTPPAANY